MSNYSFTQQSAPQAANMGDSGAADRAKQRRKKLADAYIQGIYSRTATPGGRGYAPTIRDPRPPVRRINL